MRGCSSFRGVTITECAAAAGASGVLAAMLVAGLTTPRRLSSLGESTNNLRQVVAGHAMYGADYFGKFATYSWVKGTSPSSYPDLQVAGFDMEACANQAVDILRRRYDPTFPKQLGWIPHVSTSGLVLSDYLNRPIPDRTFASPEQANLLAWQADPANWQALGAPSIRAPFGGSYESLSPAFYSTPDSGGSAIYQNQHNIYVIPGDVKLGSRTASEVAFPAQKVLSFDLYQRHFGARVGYFMYNESRVLTSMCDGSVSVRYTFAGNRGWQPTSPTYPGAQYVTYAPSSWEPPTLSGQSTDANPGQYRWTRRALAGRDFDGPEVP